MDGVTFDRLTKTLTAPGSRRRALGGLLAGAFGLAGWSGMNGAVAHDLKAKCKKKSGDAKKKCLKKAKKHAAEHADEAPPPPGPCDGTPNDSPCNGDGKCLNGVCNPKPGCLGYNKGPCLNETVCCGDFCSSGLCNTITGAATGSPCQNGLDCASGQCVGYRCQA